MKRIVPARTLQTEVEPLMDVGVRILAQVQVDLVRTVGFQYVDGA
jgi:hypothetical protein